ncbi:MAG: DUF6427 family protein [Robiginitalea sp.]
MISSLFGKTRPVNYILVLSLLFAFYVLAHLGVSDRPFEASNIIPWTLGLACLLFSIFIVNFIVQRNQLTSAHSLGMLFYCFFIILFPDTMLDREVIFANVFLLLALRRLISMKSLKNPKGKIFDGALWILASSLFINWNLLFLVLVWLYIYFYVPKNINYWLIPVTAMLAVLMIGWSVSFLIGDPDFLFRHYSFSRPELDLEIFPRGSLIKAGVFLVTVITAGIASFVKQGKSSQGQLTQLRLLVLGWLLGVLIIFLTGERGSSTILFIFFPSAIFAARYLSTVRRELLKNVLIFGVMIISLTFFFLKWVVK